MKPGPDPKEARQSAAREKAEATQSRLAAIVEFSEDAIISNDLDANVTTP